MVRGGYQSHKRQNYFYASAVGETVCVNELRVVLKQPARGRIESPAGSEQVKKIGYFGSEVKRR